MDIETGFVCSKLFWSWFKALAGNPLIISEIKNKQIDFISIEVSVTIILS